MINPTVDEEIHVQSSNVELGDALKHHCKTEIMELCGKYFGKLTRATAHFRHEGPNFACSVQIKCGGLEPFAAEFVSRDAHQAFNCALEKVAKQMRRNKRALREDKAHRLDKDERMIGRELRPQAPPAPHHARPVEEDHQVIVLHPEAERYAREMAKRHAAE